MVATTGWPDRLLALDDWGSLPSDEWHHVECSEGVLVVTPKPLPRHQRAMVRLTDSLDRQLSSDRVALADVDVLLAQRPLTMRAPDVVVTLRRLLGDNPAHLDAVDVSLAIEIMSQGSRRTDQVTKMSEYAEAGIAEYWVVDVDGPVSLECYRLDERGCYALAGSHRGSSSLTVGEDNVHVDLDTLVT